MLAGNKTTRRGRIYFYLGSLDKMDQLGSMFKEGNADGERVIRRLVCRPSELGVLGSETWDRI